MSDFEAVLFSWKVLYALRLRSEHVSLVLEGLFLDQGRLKDV